MAIKKKKRKNLNSKVKIKKAGVTKKSARKKAPARKKIAKKTVKKPAPAKKIKANIIGKITHYFPHVMAGVIKVKKPLAVGDEVKIKGHTTDFTQKVGSMQIDRASIESAKKGDEIGLLVESRVRKGDIVYKV